MGDSLLAIRALTEGNVRGKQFLNPSILTQGQYRIDRPTLPRRFWLRLTVMS